MRQNHTRSRDSHPFREDVRASSRVGSDLPLTLLELRHLVAGPADNCFKLRHLRSNAGRMVNGVLCPANDLTMIVNSSREAVASLAFLLSTNFKCETKAL